MRPVTTSGYSVQKNVSQTIIFGDSWKSASISIAQGKGEAGKRQLINGEDLDTGIAASHGKGYNASYADGSVRNSSFVYVNDDTKTPLPCGILKILSHNTNANDQSLKGEFL